MTLSIDLQLALVALFAVLAGYVIISSLVLQYRLKTQHPRYFKKIGEPDLLMLGYFSEKKYLIGQLYFLKLVSRGIPKDFPNDLKLRRLARRICVAGKAMLGLWFVGVVWVCLGIIVHHI